MRAVVFDQPGSPEVMRIGEVSIPTPGPKEVLVKVHATALNRADTLQRRGFYPPPPGASDILGLEMAGIVVAVGESVTGWEKGDRIMGLLSGGGYASFVVIHEDMALPIPEGMDFAQAAAIPEAFLTAFQAIVLIARFQKGESILIHAGASGVGTSAIQIARELLPQKIFVTASAPKHDICKALGADVLIDYKKSDFSRIIRDKSDDSGVDVIIDFLGASYLAKNLDAIATDGRIVLLALMGGAKADDVNLGHVLRKRVQITGSTLRARSLEYKIDLSKRFAAFALPRFNSGAIKPIIDSVLDWSEVVEAHRYMEANKNKGKIVLTIDS